MGKITFLNDLRQLSSFHLKFSNFCVLKFGNLFVFLCFLLEEVYFIGVDVIDTSCALHSLRLWDIRLTSSPTKYLTALTNQVLHLLLLVHTGKVYFLDLIDVES